MPNEVQSTMIFKNIMTKMTDATLQAYLKAVDEFQPGADMQTKVRMADKIAEACKAVRDAADCPVQTSEELILTGLQLTEGEMILRIVSHIKSKAAGNQQASRDGRWKIEARRDIELFMRRGILFSLQDRTGSKPSLPVAYLMSENIQEVLNTAYPADANCTQAEFDEFKAGIKTTMDRHQAQTTRSIAMANKFSIDHLVMLARRCKETQISFEELEKVIIMIRGVRPSYSQLMNIAKTGVLKIFFAGTENMKAGGLFSNPGVITKSRLINCLGVLCHLPTITSCMMSEGTTADLGNLLCKVFRAQNEVLSSDINSTSPAEYLAHYLLIQKNNRLADKNRQFIKNAFRTIKVTEY